MHTDTAVSDAGFVFTASRPEFAVPNGACDCHVHLFGPRARYPLAIRRAYTPMDARPSDLRRMMAALGLSRAIIVQPSVYGADNRLLLDALDELGGQFRGIAVAGRDEDEGMLADLDRAGARGLRCNLAVGGRAAEHAMEHVLAAASIAARRNWHVQINVASDALEALVPMLSLLPVDIVLDHFAGVRLLSPYADTVTTDLLRRLLASGRVWIKLSAPYRACPSLEYLPVLKGLVRTFFAENPDRLVWGSDWPHTPSHAGIGMADAKPVPFRPFNTGNLFDQLADWLPDASARQRILVDNPAVLYGFTGSDR